MADGIGLVPTNGRVGGGAMAGLWRRVAWEGALRLAVSEGAATTMERCWEEFGLDQLTDGGVESDGMVETNGREGEEQ